MKKTMLLVAATCALLNLTSHAHAAPKSAQRKEAQIRLMCRDKNTRIMMIRELMSTNERKQEMAEMLEHDAIFLSLYETQAVNPG